jgi:WD40 repeat protein
MRITSARLDNKGVYHAMGSDGNVASYSIEELEKCAAGQSNRRLSGPSVKLSSGMTSTIAAATVGTALVEINSDRMIKLSSGDTATNATGEAFMRKLPAHEDAVIGVRNITSCVLSEAAFFTFSGNGTVHFWDAHGVSVAEGIRCPVETSPEMWGMPNELTAAAALPDGTIMISGDKYGTLTLLDPATRGIVHQVRAHAAEILDLIAFEREGAQFLVSASRDRTVQLFSYRDHRPELLQTMDEHAGAVTSLLLAQNGTQLLSCSADRTIVVRDSIFRDPADPTTLAFVMLRVITLKSAPLSMCLAAPPDSIMVSTLDRCITKYSIKNGQAGFSFKCSDNDGGEAAVMSRILYAPSLNGNPTIAGVSSSDKSVRLYSEYGTLIARDWGHTEGITDMAIVPPKSRDGASPPFISPRIVTVAADSTIFLWNSMVAANQNTGQLPESANDGHSTPVTTPLGPPLRKVISHSEISRYRRDKSVEDLDPLSPGVKGTPSRLASPPKVRKKNSRISLAPAPRLEPALRAAHESSRHKSLKNRSPSPPSPRSTKPRELTRRQSVGTTLRSQNSESTLSNHTAAGFGTLTASTESVCRTLRAYRKKLSSAPASDTISPDALRELEKELKLTAKVVGERSHSRSIDEATLAKLLDQASQKFAGLLDEQIRTRVESELSSRGAMEGSASPSPPPPVPPLPSTMAFRAEPEAEEQITTERTKTLDTAPGASEHGQPTPLQ